MESKTKKLWRIFFGTTLFRQLKPKLLDLLKIVLEGLNTPPPFLGLFVWKKATSLRVKQFFCLFQLKPICYRYIYECIIIISNLCCVMMSYQGGLGYDQIVLHSFNSFLKLIFYFLV